MGLLSRLFGNANDNAGVTAPQEQPSFTSPRRGASLARQVEQCFESNARCLGTALMVVATKDNQGMFPGFCNFLTDFLESLAPSLERMLRTESGKVAAGLVPDYSEYSSQEQASRCLAQYYYNLGDKALLRANGGSYQITFSTQANTLMRTAKIAISHCLSLLKTAMEVGADDLVSIMLDDPSYLLGLADYFLLLQANLIHMQHRNSVVFIPDRCLDSDSDSNRTLLRNYDNDISESSRMIPLPSSLSLIWLPNEDGNVALGHSKLSGEPGTFYRIDDHKAQEYLDGIAYYFVKGIGY